MYKACTTDLFYICSVEHIGPWHYTENARTELGFNDLWYHNLSLDENATSVIFQESGLYLIYAQVKEISSISCQEKIYNESLFPGLLQKHPNQEG